MTLIRWQPFRDLDDIIAHCSPFLGHASRNRLAAVDGGSGDRTWTPVANISETATEYLIKAELPEVSREDVKVTVEDGIISIRGERRNELEQTDEKVHRVESFYGSFARSFRLPEDADVTAIQAESKNGVLRVRVPKQPAAQARTVEVQVN